MADKKVSELGLKFVVEGYDKFKTSMRGYSGSLRQATKDLQGFVTGANKQAGQMGKASKVTEDMRNQLDMMKAGMDGLHIKFEETADGVVRLTSTSREGAEYAEGLGNALRQMGWEVEQVEDKTKKAERTQREFWEGWQYALSTYGAMRGGLLFRFARASGGAWWKVAMGALVAQKAIEAVVKVLDKALERLEATGKTQAARAAFISLADGSAEAFNKMKREIEEVTHYTEEAYDVLGLQNQMLIKGYQDLADAIPAITEVAFVQAYATGEDTLGLLDEWVKAIATADAEALEADHGFTGLTDAVEELGEETGVATEFLTDEAKQVVILTELLPQLQKRMEDLGGAQENFALDTKAYVEGLKEWLGEIGTSIVVDLAVGIGKDPATMAERAELQRVKQEYTLTRAAIKAAVEEGELTQEALYKSKREYWRLGFPVGDTMRKWTESLERQRRILHPPGPIPPDARLQWGLSEEEDQRLKALANAAEAMQEDIDEATEKAIESLGEEVVALMQYGMSAEDVLTLLAAKSIELTALYEELGADIFTPAGLARLEQFNLGLQDTVNYVEQQAERQEEINELIQEYTLKAMDAGLPYEKALELGEEMGRQINELGDLSTTVALHSMDVIEGAFEGLMDRMGRGVDDLMGKLITGAWEVEQALQKEAKRTAVQIAPYAEFEHVMQAYEGYLTELRAWQLEYGADPTSLKAMAARETIDARWAKVTRDLQRAAQGLGRSTSDLKKAAEAMLLSSAAGNAALAYELEHGKSPLQAYARHEEPLTAWMMDKIAGERYAKEHGGQAPPDEWWEARWFKVYGPLHQYRAPGAPIMAGEGPEWDEARARLAQQGVTEATQEAADVWHNEYLARKKLIPPLESSAKKFITLDEAIGNLIVAFEEATERLKGPEKEGEEEEEEGEASERGMGSPRMRVPEMARGGWTGGRTGYTLTHANELMLPLSDAARTNTLLEQALRSGRLPLRGDSPLRGGGVVVQGLSVPVYVTAPVSERMARDVGESVSRVGSQIGTQIIRAAQRAGLA